MKRISNYCTRGQVFIYNQLWSVFGKDKVPSSIKPNGSLEFKTRPYLVTSNDDGNYSSTTVNLVPITTRSGAILPCQVAFVHDDRPQVVLCEQPTTANIKDLGEYLFTLSEPLMEEVGAAIAIQHKITIKPVEYQVDNVMAMLNGAVDKVLARAKQQASAIPSSQIEELTLKLAMGMEELLPNQTTHQDTSVEPIHSQEQHKDASQGDSVKKPGTHYLDTQYRPSQVEKFNRRYNRQSASQSPQETDSSPIKKGRQPSWDIDKCKQFLRDFDKMTPTAVAEKYGIENKKYIFQRKYQIKVRLESQGINYLED